MTYTYKEYDHIFDTPAKKEQEKVIVIKIMDLLNKNKYDNIQEFIDRNTTYQNFLKNNSLDNVVKHFGNTLSEQDFINIQKQLLNLTEKKKNFDKENIKTTNINDEQYVSFTGTDKDYYLDNSHSNMSVERQMEELQKEQEDFQTADSKRNTENMFKELEDSKKEKFNLRYINEININNLNESEKEFFQVMLDYQLSINDIIKVDIEKRIIVDSNNNIMRVLKENGEFKIIGDEEKSIDSSAEKKEEKTFQKTMKASTNTIYSNRE